MDGLVDRLFASVPTEWIETRVVSPVEIGVKGMFVAVIGVDVSVWVAIRVGPAVSVAIAVEVCVAVSIGVGVMVNVGVVGVAEAVGVPNIRTR